jgi:hypothetical protein
MNSQLEQFKQMKQKFKSLIKRIVKQNLVSGSLDLLKI